MPEKFYIATAIPYLNGQPHLGHALEWVYSDVIARWHRAQGQTVTFAMGSDDHGQKVIQAAEKNGVSPREQVERTLQLFQDLAQDLGVSYDDWIGTSSERHQRAATEFWKRLDAAGAFEFREYSGWYCVGCEAFKIETDLTPDGLCPDHNVKPELREEQNYFFKLSAYQDRLLQYYADHPELVVPDEKYTEMRNFVANGLEDVSFSRMKDATGWGVPVPDDDQQVMYVWCDGLTNYLTAAGFSDQLDVNQLWPADVIVIGKDINRFHSILFTAMLLAANLPVPKQFGVHGHIMSNGQKMSKSLGNVIDPQELIARYGAEATRYLLLREVPFRSDGDISIEHLDERYTADLCNGIGNLLSRTTNMIEKYCEGKIGVVTNAGLVGNADLRSLRKADGYDQAMTDYKFHVALETIWQVIAQANQVIDETKPWELAKTDLSAVKNILEEIAFDILEISQLLTPFMPETAATITATLQADQIVKSVPLFPRLEK